MQSCGSTILNSFLPLYRQRYSLKAAEKKQLPRGFIKYAFINVM